MMDMVKQNPRLFWGAVSIGAIALLAGLFVFLNSGESIPRGLLQRSEEKSQSIEAVLEGVSSRLLALQARLEAEEVSQDMIEEVADIRADWALVSKKSAEEEEMWRIIDQGLQDLEHTLRSRMGSPPGS